MATRRRIPTDRLVGRIFPLFIVAYIVLFGIFRAKGLYLNNFGFGYLIILLPIWLVDGLRSLFELILPKEYRYSEEDLSKIDVIIACKDGEDVIGRTVSDLKKRFAPDQIIVVSNGSTDRTCQILAGLSVRYFDIPEAVGKVRAINYGLQHSTRPYVLLLDDDTFIGRAHLSTGLLDDGFDAIAFRVFVKKGSWVTRFQRYEYQKTSDIGKRYNNRKASVQNVSGAIGLFRRKALERQIKRHTGEFSGEDLQRTLLIHLAQHTKGVVLAHSVVETVAPDTLVTLYDQRVFGWYPGLYANAVNYFKVMTRDYMPLSLRFDAFYNLFLVMCLDILRLLSLPILIFYPWYFAIMYLTYLIVEAPSFYISGYYEPWWVWVLYPLYGLFGFMTRVCAFVVFVYRRLVVALARKTFLDDYRVAQQPIKLLSAVLSISLLGCVLLLNLLFGYAQRIHF